MMPTPKMLSDDQKDYVEVCFYQVWREEDPRDLYEFVAQESEMFVTAHPEFKRLQGLVEKEFLRLVRANSGHE